MKIYINHFNLDILADLLKILDEYKLKTQEYVQIYSCDGIFMVDSASTIKLNPIDHDIIIMPKFHQDFTLIVDPSFYIVEKAGQIPPDHISEKIKRDIFVLHKNANKENNKSSQQNNVNQQNKIKLVIETAIKVSTNDFSFLNNNKTENADQYKDIYFELPNGTNIDDALVKEEIIEFLSLLN